MSAQPSISGPHRARRTATPVELPLRFVLGTSQRTLRRVPLLLVDVETEEGVTGRAWLFCYLKPAAAADRQPAERGRAAD